MHCSGSHTAIHAIIYMILCFFESLQSTSCSLETCSYTSTVLLFLSDVSKAHAIFLSCLQIMSEVSSNSVHASQGSSRPVINLGGAGTEITRISRARWLHRLHWLHWMHW